MRNMRLKAALGMAGVLAMTAACCVVGPALAADSASTADEIVRGGEPDGDVQYPGKEYIVENYDKWDKIAEEYAPEIIRYSNGQLVQRTPTEYECPHWMQQSWTISYNTYYLDADNRGCNSCHADMNAMIENMEYKHATIDNKALETYSDVNQCISCHRDNGDDFGRLIHAIHYNERSGNKFAEGSNGTCQSCHDATADGNGMQLWDNVKHEALQGINKVENVQGEFASTQDKVQTQDELYSYDFVHGYYDHMRYACGPNGLDIDLPQSMFDEWEFTVDGNVNAPYTKKLPELVAVSRSAGSSRRLAATPKTPTACASFAQTGLRAAGSTSRSWTKGIWCTRSMANTSAHVTASRSCIGRRPTMPRSSRSRSTATTCRPMS